MARIILIGGGKLAANLIEPLYTEHDELVVIECDGVRARQLADRFQAIDVLIGDGTTIGMLEEARAHDADFFIAVTGKDEDNLIGCLIAKSCFHVKTTVARVNNPRNLRMFREMNVDLVYNSTMIIADMIGSNIQYNDMRVAFNLHNSPQFIVEIKVNDKSRALNIPLSQLEMPGRSRVVAIIDRQGASVVPDGRTSISRGDTLLVIAEEQEYDALYAMFVK